MSSLPAPARPQGAALAGRARKRQAKHMRYPPCQEHAAARGKPARPGRPRTAGTIAQVTTSKLNNPAVSSPACSRSRAVGQRRASPRAAQARGTALADAWQARVKPDATWGHCRNSIAETRFACSQRAVMTAPALAAADAASFAAGGTIPMSFFKPCGVASVAARGRGRVSDQRLDSKQSRWSCSPRVTGSIKPPRTL